MIRTIRSHFLRDKLLRNTGWMLVSEAIAKVSRIITILAMANLLSPALFGIASLAIVCHELIRVFSRAGAGATVIQCDEEQLPKIAANASLLQWLMCTTLTVAQVLAAPAIAHFYQEPALQPLLTIMAFTYLCYPLVSIKVFMLQRENRMQYFALGNAVSVSVDNLSIVLFLLLGEGIYAIAYAKVVTAIVWVFIFGSVRIGNYWPKFHRHVFFRLVAISSHIFSTEVLRVLRAQIDILIAGKLLSPELFGLYSFAKNAGVGLSQSIITAYIAGLYPYLCERFRAKHTAQAMIKSIKYAGILSLLFVVQALLAPIYVNLLFHSQWSTAASLVSILCLAGIPAIFVDTSAMLFRAGNKTLIEAALIFYCVLIMAMVLVFAAPTTPVGLALATSLSSALWLIPLALIGLKKLSARQYAFRKTPLVKVPL